MIILLWALLAVVLTFQLVVTFRLRVFEDFTPEQRRWQLLLIWCVPLLGAWMSWSLMRSAGSHTGADRQFIPQDDQGTSPRDFGD